MENGSCFGDERLLAPIEFMAGVIGQLKAAGWSRQVLQTLFIIRRCSLFLSPHCWAPNWSGKASDPFGYNTYGLFIERVTYISDSTNCFLSIAGQKLSKMFLPARGADAPTRGEGRFKSPRFSPTDPQGRNIEATSRSARIASVCGAPLLSRHPKPQPATRD
jgi:hypothetical protein